MKKSLMIALWCGLCVCASAAFQYEVIKGPSYGDWKPGPDNRVYGSSFTIKITEGSGSVYILDKINNLNSMTGNGELLSLNANMAAGSYGYVKMDGTIGYGDGSTVETYSVKLENQQLVTQLGYKIGDFSEGDEIGIWLTDKNGNTGASILDKSYAVNSDQINDRGAFLGQDALGNDLFKLGFNSGPIHFGISDGTSGKPLPGVLATLLLGSAALGAMGMKKRSVAQA